ncbi:MAG: P-loop NTPase [Desulfobacteraceae bacterium]|nr:P-loop NTPase [Desulfobacteraceae bacterium]
MIISVASGKGGTGKTTIATALASSLGSGVQLLDCDVEEPNAHLFIKPVFDETETVTTPVPEVDPKKCSLCGKCGEICQFKAIVMISDFVMCFHELCHSCGGCVAVCPENAVTETARELGTIRKSSRNGLELVCGTLKIGEAMSPPLIRKVRSFAVQEKITIIDAPPGTSCPVIASLKETDFVLLVTEPTPFGLHDLKLAVEAVRKLNIPGGLIINRSDIGDDRVAEYAHKENLPILMEIPFDRKIAEACSRGKLITEALPELKQKFEELYHAVIQIIKKQEQFE